MNQIVDKFLLYIGSLIKRDENDVVFLNTN